MIPSRLLVVTDRHGSARPLVDTVSAVLDGGARWVWFRDKDLERSARRDLACELLDLVRAAGARLTIGGDAALATEIGADGVHLGARQLTCAPHAIDAFGHRATDPRSSSREEAGGGQSLRADVTGVARGSVPPRDTAMTAPATRRRGGSALLGFSAHSLSDIREAAQANASYVTLSPIFASVSKPGYGPALGVAALREAAALGLPVIALGGIGPQEAEACCVAGVAGVAVMGGLMRAPDPKAATRRLLRTLNALT